MARTSLRCTWKDGCAVRLAQAHCRTPACQTSPVTAAPNCAVAAIANLVQQFRGVFSGWFSMPRRTPWVLRMAINVGRSSLQQPGIATQYRRPHCHGQLATLLHFFSVLPTHPPNWLPGACNLPNFACARTCSGVAHSVDSSGRSKCRSLQSPLPALPRATLPNVRRRFRWGEIVVGGAVTLAPPLGHVVIKLVCQSWRS